MPRAPFQVLVFPYRQLKDGSMEYVLMRRADQGWWQPIAGGGEDDETPEQAARREAYEEAGLPGELSLVRLDTVEPIPVVYFRDSHLWGDEIYVIPQYCFGLSVIDDKIVLSPEHSEYRWLSYLAAQSLLKFDGNRTALWELHARLTGLGPRALGREGLA